MKRLIIGCIAALSMSLSTSYASQTNTSAQVALALAIIFEAQNQQGNVEGVIPPVQGTITTQNAKKIKQPSYEKPSNNTNNGYDRIKKKGYKFGFRQ